MSSSHSLARTVFGTDALTVNKLFDVGGWVAVGEYYFLLLKLLPNDVLMLTGPK